jgi:CRP-like cAMP-binding protein
MKDKDVASIWLFSECSGRELKAIAKATDEVTVPAGRILVEEGTLGRELYLIVEGTATVRRNNRKVASLGAGQHFGELALLDRRPRTATVVSETEMTLLVLGQREFNALLDTTPALARKLMSAMATRLREQDSKTVQ